MDISLRRMILWRIQKPLYIATKKWLKMSSSLNGKGQDMHLLSNDIIIDAFAGGGGASLGIEMALGHPVEVVE